MGLKLEVGKYYRADNGSKVGPLRLRPSGNFDVADGSASLWTPDGRAMYGVQLVAEWTDAPAGPVRTVTRTTREIVPGEYDGLDVGRAVNGTVFLAMPIANHCQESIGAIIANLTAIRDALEDV